jgi:hypothetical protein
MIYSPEREKQWSNQSTCNYIYIKKFYSIKWLLTLFAPILLHHVRMGYSSSSFSMLSPPLLGINGLSFPLSGGLGMPSPPPPILTPFLSGPRQQPVTISGTIRGIKKLIKNVLTYKINIPAT